MANVHSLCRLRTKRSDERSGWKHGCVFDDVIPKHKYTLMGGLDSGNNQASWHGITVRFICLQITLWIREAACEQMKLMMAAL
jgi:hypothetical protein